MTKEERIIWLSAFGAYSVQFHPDTHNTLRHMHCIEHADYAVYLYRQAKTNRKELSSE